MPWICYGTLDLFSQSINCCSLFNCLAQRHLHFSLWGRGKPFTSTSTSQLTPHSAGLGFRLVTSWPTVAGAWVAVLSLNTHCEAIEHNETACTQALSDDMPSMHRPNLHPLLPYEMHLLYVIMPFEVHRQRDINSTSVFGQLIPSVHSHHSWCYRVLAHRKKKKKERPLWSLYTTPPTGLTTP